MLRNDLLMAISAGLLVVKHLFVVLQNEQDAIQTELWMLK